MTLNRIKLFAIAILILPILAIGAFNSTPAKAVALAGDPAADFKAKCAMCHTAKAEKYFDPAKATDELVQIVLKGKKGEKPPYMPGFEAKGMTTDDAKALVEYMKGLRQPAN